MNMQQLQAPPSSLERASRRAGWVTLVGASVVFASLGYSAFKLSRMNAQVATKRAEVQTQAMAVAEKEAVARSLDEQIHALRRQKEDLLHGLRTQEQRLARYETRRAPSPKSGVATLPISAAVTPRVSSEAKATTSGAKPTYVFSLWLDVPSSRRGEMDQVTYFFNHPTFRQPKLVSQDPQSGFRVSYEGWGCLTRVIITVRMKNGEAHDVDFDMCAALQEA